MEVSFGDDLNAWQDSYLVKNLRSLSGGLEALVLGSGAESRSGNRNPDGSISYSLRGTVAQGEGDTPSVARILIRRLNRSGANWGEPECVGPQSDDIDCIARDGDKSLKIQVTKAIHHEERLRKLSRDGSAQGIAQSRNLIERLKGSIQKKATRYPVEQRRKLVLALDAHHAPDMLLTKVLTEFEAQHGLWLREQGFREVWLVGPSEDETFRLDQPKT